MSVMDGTTSQKISKDIFNTISQMDLTDIYRIHYPTIRVHILLS